MDHLAVAPVRDVPRMVGVPPGIQGRGIWCIPPQMLLLPEVYILDEEVGVAVVDIPYPHDLLSLHYTSDGHLSPLVIDCVIQKAFVEGHEAPFGYVQVLWFAPPAHFGLVDFQERALFSVHRLDDNPSQEYQFSLIRMGSLLQFSKGNLCVYLVQDLFWDDMGAAGRKDKKCDEKKEPFPHTAMVF